MKNRISTLLVVITPLALFVASFGLYYSTLAPGMLRGDSGEFQWAMASLNVAHATGYPLFTLLGYLWEQLPLDGPVAWRLNLISAIFGAAAVATVFVTSRRASGRLAAAFVAAIFFALSPVFWFNASILEVYTLNAFFLALIIYLLLRWSANPASSAAIYLAFFVLGLALAHHRMIVLAIPGILVFLALTDLRFFLNLKRLVTLALVLVPGLALYIYVPVRLVAAGATLHYAFFDIILGQEFAASLFREFHFEQVLWQIPEENFHAGLALAALGAITLFRRQRNLAILLLLIYLADVAFALAYWVPDVDVFLTPSFVIIAIWIAAGAAWLIAWFQDHLAPRFAVPAAAAAGLLLVAFPFVGLRNYPVIVTQVAGEAGTSETRARALLAAGLPAGALVELDWETATAVRFLQTTELQRRDLEARLIKIDERDEYNWVLKNVDSGRPVFVERGVNWTRAPAGYFLRKAPVDLAEIARGTVEALAVGVKIDDKAELAALRNDNQMLVLYWRVLQPLHRDLATFVHFFNADGQPLGQQDHAPCCQAIYGYRTTEWQLGRQVADTFNPAPSGATYLQVGMYAVDNGDIDSNGRTLALQIAPVSPAPTSQPLGIALVNGIVARAYQLSDNDKNLGLTVYWEDRGRIGKDYAVFARLLDASGRVLQQAEHQPLAGLYPTSAWKAGQIIRDSFVLTSTSSAVKVEIGAEDPATGQRVARADGGGDSIIINLW